MRISLRFNIVTNFILLILLVTTLLLGLQYYSSHKIASQAIDKTFRQVSNNTTKFIERSESFVKRTISLMALNSDLSNNLLTADTHPILDDFTQVLNNHKASTSIYIGYSNGDFYELIMLKKRPDFVTLHNPPQKSRWAVLKIINRENTRYSTLKFLDENLDVILTKNIKNKFITKNRPWYKKAIKSDDVIRTDMYTFSSTKVQGITFAKQTPNKNAVIAIDFTMSGLDDFIKEQSFDELSHIILYSDSGELLASSNQEKLHNWKKVFDFFKNSDGGITLKHVDGDREYFIYHTMNKDSLGNLNVGIIMPKEKLLEPYMREITNSLYAALIFVLLSIPVAFYLSSVIVKPIRSLMLENEKIKNRDFDKVQNINSSILELHELSSSLVSMSTSIQE